MRELTETLLLEEKMISVSEKKVKEELKLLNDTVLELGKQTLLTHEEVAKEKKDLEAQRELTLAKLKHLKEDLALLRLERHQRCDQADKLKIKYDIFVKAMGTEQTFVDGRPQQHEVPSHAFHLIQLAQEKAELKEEGETLATRVEREERELVGLEKAMALMNNSNGRYRSQNFRIAASETEETKELQERIKACQHHIEQLQNKIDATEAEIKLLEHQLLKCDAELAEVQTRYQETSEYLSQLEKEAKDQEVKLERAEKVAGDLSVALRSSNQSAEVYERDMDLR
jgi:hypothetical protein